jgi:hypothetical protein
MGVVTEASQSYTANTLAFEQDSVIPGQIPSTFKNFLLLLFLLGLSDNLDLAMLGCDFR